VIHPWRTLARRILLRRPPWFEVGEETVGLPDGRTVEDFAFIDMLSFAVIVAVTPDDRVVLVRSYKHGIREVALSLPAGGFTAAEPAEAAARRELLEETGYAADRWTALGRFVVDANYGCGSMHPFLAVGARKTAEPDGNDLEEMEVVVLPFDEVARELRTGGIKQMSSAAAFGLAVLARERERAG
jgi:ADP-ribose diphosphatase